MSDELEEPILLPLRVDRDVWKDSTGRALLMCVFHRLDSQQTEEAQASTIVGGYSVCEEHSDLLLGFIMAGYPMETLVAMQYEGVLQGLHQTVKHAVEKEQHDREQRPARDDGECGDHPHP